MKAIPDRNAGLLTTNTEKMLPKVMTIPEEAITPEIALADPVGFINYTGLMKAAKSLNSPGAIGPTKGFIETGRNYYNARGIRENLPPLPFTVCREVTRKNPIVAAIVNTRCRQMRPFSRPTNDQDEPGFRIKMRDPEAKPTNKEKDEIKYLQDFFLFSGRTDFEGWEDRDDNLNRIMVKMCRDFLEIDQTAIEIRRDRAGNAVDFWIMDAATIRRVRFSGLQGSPGDIDPRRNLMWNKIEEAIADQKIAQIPNFEDIRYVQLIDDQLIAGFTARDMIFEVMNERTDIRYTGYGYPLVEQAMSVITAFVYGLAYNTSGLNHGDLPKVALVFKDGNFGEDELIRLQDEMISNWRGHFGPFRIPMLSGDVEIKDFYKTPRDMEYNKFMEFVASVNCSIYGIDPAEMGLHFQQAKSSLGGQGGMKARQKFSKDRGLDDLLGCMRMTFNRKMRVMQTVSTGARNKVYSELMWKKYEFEYTGVIAQDMEAKSKRETERVARDTTVNELRKEQDKEPLPYGDIILNPQYIQWATGQQQAEQMQQEQGEGEGEEDFDFGGEMDGAIDEAFDEGDNFNKAEKRCRTLLK